MNGSRDDFEQSVSVPVLGTWRRWYLALLLELVVLILVFRLLTVVFR